MILGSLGSAGDFSLGDSSVMVVGVPSSLKAFLSWVGMVRSLGAGRASLSPHGLPDNTLVSG